ncbi:MAG: bifunctional heptose 7-phosphate kinase/heptose 1-phosphate adenyltransferase, partial [Chloroflexota bacterium]
MSTTFGNLIERFAQRRVLVLGDMVADEYLIGTPSRISREAPVLILHHAGSFIRPGGATNAAYNLSGLRAGTRVIGVIGDDEMGTRLKAALATAGIDDSGLLVDSARPTTTSTRVVARGTQGVQQQIVRIDRLESKPVPGSLRDAMIEATCRLMQEVDVLLISDYTHGVISPELIDACIPVARARGVKIVV